MEWHKNITKVFLCVVMMFPLLCSGNALAQSEFFEVEIPIALPNGTLGDLEGLYVRVESQDLSFSYEDTVKSDGKMVLQYVPLGVNLDVQLLSSFLPPPNQAGNPNTGLFCDQTITIRLDSSADCSFYDPGTSPGYDDKCDLATLSPSLESPGNIITSLVQYKDPNSGNLLPLIGAQINVSSTDPNGSFF